MKWYKKCFIPYMFLVNIHISIKLSIGSDAVAHKESATHLFIQSFHFKGVETTSGLLSVPC